MFLPWELWLAFRRGSSCNQEASDERITIEENRKDQS